MIARLLHIANSAPPTNKAKRERFYAMKQRILRWFGREDGYDLQQIDGKQCWSCGGTGGYYTEHDCYKCGGDGWYKSPVWITLKRWKFGRYTFHEPIQRLYRKPDTNSLPSQGSESRSLYPVPAIRLGIALERNRQLVDSQSD